MTHEILLKLKRFNFQDRATVWYDLISEKDIVDYVVLEE